MMDSNDFRSILESAGIDIWMLMDVAIAVASADHSDELRRRRDGIVERLYATSFLSSSRCPNCDIDDVRETEMQSNPSAEEEKDTCEVLFDDEQKKILEIKEQLEDPHQSKDSLLDLLQNLADMDITFRALQETDIGRHVNRLRKHSSNDVKKLVKLLVRKWKEIIDEWVKLKTPGEASTTVMDECFGSEHNNIEPQQRKPKAIRHKESPLKPSASRQRDSNFELDKLASARKRLQENYKEVANAKKQRTIQVMDLHELPKPKNAYFGKSKGGTTSQGRHW